MRQKQNVLNVEKPTTRDYVGGQKSGKNTDVSTAEKSTRNPLIIKGGVG